MKRLAVALVIGAILIGGVQVIPRSYLDSLAYSAVCVAGEVRNALQATYRWIPR